MAHFLRTIAGKHAAEATMHDSLVTTHWFNTLFLSAAIGVVLFVAAVILMIGVVPG
jgi:hypothetical protein